MDIDWQVMSLNKDFMKSFVFPLFVVTLVFAYSCRKSDEYKKYIGDGEIVYPAKPVSIKSHTGDGRIMLSWVRTDPKVVKYVVSWNLGTDSVLVDVAGSANPNEGDTIRTLIDGLAENNYEFSIVAIDDDNNRSVPVPLAGSVLGNNYRSTLLPRGIRSVRVSPVDNRVSVQWYDTDSTYLGALFGYTSLDGTEVVEFIENTGSESIISNFTPGTSFAYKSVYKPDLLAIDSFYTNEVTNVRPVIMYPELDRGKFSPMSIPGDAASGFNWFLEYLWDNSLAEGRGFHTSGGTFPIYFTLDLGVMAELHHFKIWQRTVNNIAYGGGNIKSFEMWGTDDISPQADETEWKLLGSFEFLKPSGLPLGSLTEADRAKALAGEDFRFDEGTSSVRYVRFKVNDAWLPTANAIHLMELSFFGLVW